MLIRLPALVFVLAALGIGRFAVLVLPFRWIAPLLGRSLGPVAWTPLASSSQTRKAKEVGRMVRGVARRTPWNSNCLAQVIVARLILGLLGVPYAIHFGVSSSGNGAAEAHAWLVCDRVFVTGGNGFGRYAVVATFVSHQAGA